MEAARTRPWVVVAAMLLAGAVTYAPALSAWFIWDDDGYITGNETLRSLHGLWEIWFIRGATPQYYPLVHTMFWLEYQAWGLWAPGYHIVNLLLHVLGAWLWWCLLRRLSVPQAGALLAAWLWLLHPIQVETVAWITERKNVLSMALYLAAAWLWLDWRLGPATVRRGRSITVYIAVCLLYLGALWAKTVTLTLPAALLLVVWWKTREPDRSAPAPTPLGWRDLVLLTPLLLVGMIKGSITMAMEIHDVGAKGPDWDWSLLERCLIAGRVFVFYARKVVWPDVFIFNYPRWTIDAGAWQAWLYPAGVLVVVIGLGLLRRRVGRGPLVAALFYFGTLMPASGFFDVYPMRFSFVADHFSYHAIMGVMVLLATCLVHLARWLPRPRSTGGILAVLALGGLAFHSWSQCHAYHDERTLWEDTLSKNPGSWMAHNYLGRWYERGFERARDPRVAQQALWHYDQGLALHKGFAQLHANRGSALLKLDRPADAIAPLRESVRLQPDLPQGHYYLGMALELTGRRNEAIQHYRQAVELAPRYVSAHHRLGRMLLQRGDLEEARRCYEAALRLRPGAPAALYELGVALRRMGQWEQAAGRLRDALAAQPDQPLVTRELAATLRDWAAALDDEGDAAKARRLRAEADRMEGH